MAHSFVSSFGSLDDLGDRTLVATDGTVHDLAEVALRHRQRLEAEQTNEGEPVDVVK